MSWPATRTSSRNRRAAPQLTCIEPGAPDQCSQVATPTGRPPAPRTVNLAPQPGRIGPGIGSSGSTRSQRRATCPLTSRSMSSPPAGSVKTADTTPSIRSAHRRRVSAAGPLWAAWFQRRLSLWAGRGSARQAHTTQPPEDSMRMHSPPARRLSVIAMPTRLLIALGGAVAAGAAPHAGRAGPRRVAVPVGLSGKGTAASPGEFTKTANPLTLDQPLQVPPVKPVVVTIADHVAFGNGPPPFTQTVNLPSGHWADVVLDVSGTESGRQFDRLCEVFAGPSEIFLGVTPEPTPAGIRWHVQKNITGYLPLLSGTQTFTTFVDNFLSTTDNGVPVITAKLLFYPAGPGFAPAHPVSLGSPALAGDAINETGPAAPPQHAGVPTQVVPILPQGATTTLNTLNAGQTLSATVTLPTNTTTANLDLYAVGHINDEFWWSLNPAFREIEVSIDGKPAGVVWPYPYVYTGGVNPLIWRPVTGIHTMDIPSYRLDLTPFAGMLGGTHTISLTVANNTGYWLAGGTMLLGTDGQTTSGGVTSDTLSFPTASRVVTKHALSSADKPVTSESAAASYQIAGTVTQDGRTWTDTTGQRLQFGDDQSYINPTCATA